jgi:hypothetical protein
VPPLPSTHTPNGVPYAASGNASADHLLVTVPTEEDVLGREEEVLGYFNNAPDDDPLQRTFPICTIPPGSLFLGLTIPPHHDAQWHSMAHRISAWMPGWNNSKLHSPLLPEYATALSTSWRGLVYVACLAMVLESVPWGIQYAVSTSHNTNRNYPSPSPHQRPLVLALPIVVLTYA